VDEEYLVHPPIENLQLVADFNRTSPCDIDCTWMFYPGTHTAYSSTNYVLMGFILTTHAPEGQQTWDTYNFTEGLGLSQADYPTTVFPAKGVTHE